MTGIYRDRERLYAIQEELEPLIYQLCDDAAEPLTQDDKVFVEAMEQKEWRLLTKLRKAGLWRKDEMGRVG